MEVAMLRKKEETIVHSIVHIGHSYKVEVINNYDYDECENTSSVTITDVHGESHVKHYQTPRGDGERMFPREEILQILEENF